MTLSLYIDPDERSDLARSSWPLFVENGEYANALRGLSRERELMRRVPDSIFLDIYAYEALERLRDLIAQEPEPGTLCWMPFWPACLFEAEGIKIHAAMEIQSMFPSFDRTTMAEVDHHACERAARSWLGTQHFSAGRYGVLLREQATAKGWEILQP